MVSGGNRAGSCRASAPIYPLDGCTAVAHVRTMQRYEAGYIPVPRPVAHLVRLLRRVQRPEGVEARHLVSLIPPGLPAGTLRTKNRPLRPSARGGGFA